MRLMKTFFLSVFLTTSLASAPIDVHLNTSAKKESIYLAHTETKKSSISSQVLKRVESILRFDLNYSGSTKVVPKNPSLEALCKESALGNTETLASWQAAGVNYVVKPIAEEQSLQLLLLDTHKNTVLNFPKISLQGGMDNVRNKLHRLSDSVQKTIFGKEGVASTKILFTTTKSIPKKGEIGELWEVDYDGGNPRIVAREEALLVTPSYIPPAEGFKSRNALIISYAIGQPKIYAISLEGGSPNRLTPLRGNQLMPTVSRQRDQMAFISDASGNPDLFLQPFDPNKGAVGKPRQIFAARHATEGTPSFSPDGKKIAFVSNKDGLPRIYVMQIPLPGTKSNEINIHLLTKRNAACTAPNWSPDGKKIAFCSKARGIRQIWVYDLDLKEATQLTSGPIHKENPSFAPDSLHLTFNTAQETATQIYLLDIRDKSSVKITHGPGVKRFPAWQSTKLAR